MKRKRERKRKSKRKRKRMRMRMRTRTGMKKKMKKKKKEKPEEEEEKKEESAQKEEEEEERGRRRRRGRGISGPFGGHFGVTLGSFWEPFQVHLGVTLGSFWEPSSQMELERVGQAGRPFLCAGSQFVRVTPILLQRGEPRTLKHCKNCSQMSVHLATGARPTFQWPYSPPGPLQPRAVWGIICFV